MKVAAVMLDLRRIALWVAVIVLPFGFLLLPLALAGLRRGKAASKPANEMTDGDPKTPNDGPGRTPGNSDDGTPPRLAA